MTLPSRRRLRHLRRWLGYGALVVLILFAALVGVVNQLLPLVERHPQQIAAWLSQRVGEPVNFSRARAEWTRRGPRFILDDLRVGRTGQQLDIGRAQLLVAIYSGLLPDHPLTELKVGELALGLRQDADGRWHAIGLPGQGRPSAGDPLDRLEGFGELQIERARLSLDSRRHDFRLDLPRVDVRLRVYGDRLRVGASVWARSGRPPLSAVLELQRRGGDGRAWIGGEKLGLLDWQPELRLLDLEPRAGQGELDVWLRVHDQRVTEVTARTDLRDVQVASTDSLEGADGRPQPVTARFDRLHMLARWSGDARQWRLQVPESSIELDGTTARIDGLQLLAGAQVAARAGKVDLQALASLAALSPKVPPKLRLFLAAAQPHAVLRDLRIASAGAGGWRGTVRVDALGMTPYADRPGIEGVAGQLRFDPKGGVLALDEGDPVRVRWPVALRQDEELRLAGSIGLWRDGPGWTLGGSGLRLRGAGFGARARFQIGWQGDGSKPTLDLAADLDPARFDVAKRFWILHKMPPATVQWLDGALVDGTVLGGRIAIGGDLDDWPFRNLGGTFDARAHIRDATVRFSPEWPAAQALEADVAFDGPGFTVDGAGDLLGNRIDRVTGGIADFHQPWLALDIESRSDGERLRQLLVASPLNRTFGEHLKAVRASGRADVGVQIRLPLHHDLGPRSIAGQLDLRDARLSDSRWNLQFTGVTGLTRFDQDGFATEALAVKLDGQPGRFELKVGPRTDEPGLAALATLAGDFTPQTLLARAPTLDWLRPYLSGASGWQVAVRIPAANGAQKAPPAQLLVAGDLVGTTLTLPAPLAKPAATPLPLELRTALPVEQGVVELRLGERMRLRGAIRGEEPITGSVQFGDGALPPAPARGLSIRGRVPVLDATGWIGFGAGDQGESALHDIDVQATQMNFIDRAFPDTRVQLDRGGAGLQIRLGGPAVEGSIDVPNDLNRGVQAKLSKLYLAAQSLSGVAASPAGPSPSAPTRAGKPATAARTAGATRKPAAVASPLPAAAPSPVAPAAAASIEVDDPSRLPPLRFAIDDLRLGTAQFGAAELVTSRTAAGLRVDRFQTRARALSLTASGDWVRSNGGTRSTFQLDFSANSLGQMLDALGFVGVVEGGRTRAQIAGSWPGSPGEFSLANMTGRLRAEIGEGRLLDVEPGGSGRILGLISLAEVPRRLTLDFSDFFAKGFSFNSARGDFQFTDGRAHTDNLRIDGPAAEIRVSGDAGLREQSYDQRVEVLPKAGGVLPAIGMLAGGPAGAAVGAVAQAVLQNPLKQTTRVVYHITGPWTDPKVDVVERGPPRAVSAPAPPPAPAIPDSVTPPATPSVPPAPVRPTSSRTP